MYERVNLERKMLNVTTKSKEETHEQSGPFILSKARP
jgi:hypothetical protein